jgi:hypothetical protein
MQSEKEQDYDEAETRRRLDAALKRSLNTPPKPFTPKPKKKAEASPKDGKGKSR